MRFKFNGFFTTLMQNHTKITFILYSLICNRNCWPVRMIDIKFVNILWIRIRNIEFSSRAVWDAYFPKCWAISWWLKYKINQINITTCFCTCYSYKIYVHEQKKNDNLKSFRLEVKDRTCGYGNDNIVLIISNDTRNPCIKIIVAASNIIDEEVAICIWCGPKLVALMIMIDIQSC